MTAEDAMATFAGRQGWNPDSQLTLALRYIENQQDNAAFEDFLQQQVDLENADTQELRYDGWGSQTIP